jgi:uncharacterized protein (UPF0548 family)
VRRSVTIGVGSAAFDAAANTLLSWMVHSRAGFRVAASRPTAEPGALVMLTIGAGPIRIGAPCRVVYTLTEALRRGFACGTLTGHPESGEEAFVIERTPDDAITFTITAFSRPATATARWMRSRSWSPITSARSFSLVHAPNVYTACSPVWTLAKKGSQIAEPAAFNGMLTDAAGKAAFVMHALDIVDVHICAPGPSSPNEEQVTDETSGQTSSVLVLISPKDGPLTPEFSTQEIGNALDWGGVWDTPMAFVWEIGHSDLYGSTPGAFCVPGQTNCGSFNSANWAGFKPIRIFEVTFGDGSHQQHWAAVSDTGGKAEVLGNSFVGPTDCTAYGGPYCIYPWFSSDRGAINYGVGSSNLGGVDQFAQTATCPSTGVFPDLTYCDTIIS